MVIKPLLLNYVLIQKSSTVFNNSKTGVNYGKTEKKTSLL